MKGKLNLKLWLPVTIIFWLIAIYFCRPAINIASQTLLWTIVFYSLFSMMSILITQDTWDETWFNIAIGINVVIAVIPIILMIASSLLFNSKKYANIINVETVSFEEAVQEEKIESVSLMDSKSALYLANRAAGQLDELASQFDLSTVSTVAIDEKPVKLIPLKYASIGSTFANNKTGVPGYIKVDPVKNKAEFVRLEQRMLYTPESYWNYKLSRHVYRNFPNDIQGKTFFELDDDSNPKWIIQIIDKLVGISGGKKPIGAFIIDPFTGTIEKYNLNDMPEWVDNVFSGNDISTLFGWYGKYQKGFFNATFGKKEGCRVTTDDFGYKVIGNDTFIYTGVTSVASDESNVGFLFANARTGEFKYFTAPGAEEYSAMDAANGAVANYGYQASFPSIVNINGMPVYVMVLKDEAGLIKKTAMVSVDLEKIVVKDTITACLNAYTKENKTDSNDYAIEYTADGEMMLEILDEEGAIIGTFKIQEGQGIRMK